MGPCQVCGGMAIDPAGYCTQCGTYRGPVPVTAVPVTSPITSQYPSSYIPGQYSAPPVQSAPPGPPEPRRGSSMVPLIASCLALLLVAVAIVVVLVVKKQNHRTASPGPSSSSIVDSCVVGTWSVTDATLQWTVEGVGRVPLKSQNSSQTVAVRADGTAEDDYGHSVYQGSFGAHTYLLRITGTVHYGIRSGNETLTFLAPSASGAIEYYVDGAGPTSIPLSVSTDPVHYTCSDGTLTEHTEQYDATLTRQPK